MARLCLVLAILAWVSVAVVAADAANPVVDVPRLDVAPTIDDFLDMAPSPEFAGKMAHISGLIQKEPEDGKPATQDTDVYLGYDDTALYFVFVAHDDEPDKIRAHMNRRETFNNDDLVEVMLDTFGDEQRAYTFIVSAAGTQWDAIWTEGGGFDRAWDTVWDSRVRRTDRGYVAWLSIPFKSLRFPKGAGNDWGLIVLREIPRANENSFWPPVSTRTVGRLSQEAKLRGISGISPGRNMQLIPYVTARDFELLNEEDATIQEDSFDGDAGLDAKLVFKDSLALDLTVNPDFSQVESDDAQVTANERFEVFFPEKRPFFLENADFFQTPTNLLFTRRIAAPDQGARLTGKVGSWAIGSLVIDDEAPGKLVEPDEPGRGDNAWFGVARLRRDLPRQSYFGFIFTDREFDDRSNRVMGVDGRFRLDEAWDARFQLISTSTRRIDGESSSGPGYDVSFNRDGRHIDSHIHYRDFSDDFTTDVGFVPRIDIREIHQSSSYTFWPEGDKLISWTTRLFTEYVEDQSGLRLDERFAPEIQWDYRRQTRWGLFASWGHQRLRPEDYGTLAEPEDFTTNRTAIWGSTRAVDGFDVNGRVEWRDWINFVPAEGQSPEEADELRTTLNVNLRPGLRHVIETRYLRTVLEEREGGGTIFVNDIVRTRWNWQLTTKFSMRTILQYDDTRSDPELTSLDDSENLNADFLLTYLVNPWTAVYAGYNSNYRNVELVENESGGEVIRTGSLDNDSEQIFVKASYLYRF